MATGIQFALAEASPAALMNGERLFSFAAIAAKLPGYRGNTHVNSSTVYRWATQGVKTASGQTVRLEAAKLGTAWKTSFEAVSRFSKALTDAALPADDVPLTATPASGERGELLGTAS